MDVDNIFFSLSKRNLNQNIYLDKYIVVNAKEDIYIFSTGFSIQAFSKFKKLASSVDIIHYHFPNPFADILHFFYENQKKWVRGKTIKEFNGNLKKLIVTNLPFDFTEFESCLANKDIEDHILNDRISGVKKFNIEATPTLIINGKKFDNPHNYKKLKKNIEKLI